MQLQDLQVVLKVAEFRSITAAAASLDMRTATASAAIKRVEQSLGVELFIRTTRQLRLSPAGERYIPTCQQALQTLEQAKLNLKEDLDHIEGELRIALSSDLGRNLVVPWLDEFADQHPALSLRVHLSDSNVDFYRDPVDIALRYGSPSDSNLYGFKICDVPSVLCASPDYLKNNAQPKKPEDLQHHNGLFYQLHDIVHDSWKFTDKNGEYKIKMTGNRTANDGDQVRRWCVAGKGVAVKSCIDVAEDLLAGRLVRLLPDYQPRMTELWLVCPSRHSITPTVRILRETLKEKCQTLQNKLRKKGWIG